MCYTQGMKEVHCKEKPIRCKFIYWSTKLFGKGEEEAKQRVKAEVAGDVLQMIDNRTQNLAEHIILKTQ